MKDRHIVELTYAVSVGRAMLAVRWRDRRDRQRVWNDHLQDVTLVDFRVLDAQFIAKQFPREKDPLAAWVDGLDCLDLSFDRKDRVRAVHRQFEVLTCRQVYLDWNLDSRRCYWRFLDACCIDRAVLFHDVDRKTENVDWQLIAVTQFIVAVHQGSIWQGNVGPIQDGLRQLMIARLQCMCRCLQGIPNLFTTLKCGCRIPELVSFSLKLCFGESDVALPLRLPWFQRLVVTSCSRGIWRLDAVRSPVPSCRAPYTSTHDGVGHRTRVIRAKYPAPRSPVAPT